jgi:hypothetical protein
MLTLYRLWLRIRLHMISIETAQAEAAARDIPRRLEELAHQELALRAKLNTAALRYLQLD